MNNYSVYLKILNHNFCIITHDLQLLKKQIEHVSKFCITPISYSILDNPIVIEYIEDTNAYTFLKAIFDENNYEVLNTFENEQHYKITVNNIDYYMSHNQKYILKKQNNYYYTLIGNQKSNTIKYVFRIIREILVRLQENDSKFFFHATSFRLNNKGVSLMGNSGSGKTTLFSSILLNGGEILSNDRTFIYETNNKIMMDYFPIPVVYKIGTVQNNKALNKYILNEKNHYLLPDEFYTGKVSYPIPLTDLPIIFKNTSLIENSFLDVIIFPKFILSQSKHLFVKELTYQESFNLLKSVCFTPNDYESFRKEWIYKRIKTVTELEHDADIFLNKIICSVKIFYLEFGKNTENIYDVLCNLMR